MLDLFWTAFLARDTARLRPLLHDEVTFASPAFAEPTTDADRVARVLSVARDIYTDIDLTNRYDDQAGGGALFFTAQVEGQPIQGVYRIDTADGAVLRIDALFRPVAATETLVRTMMTRLAG